MAPRRTLGWIVLVCALALQARGSAQTHGDGGPKGEWYGWQNLTVDGVALGLLTSALIVDDMEVEGTAAAWLAFGGFTTYVLASPIVDWAHGHVGLGFGSLGLRAAASFLVLAGALSNALRRDSAGSVWYAFGGLAGFTAITMDAVLDRGPAPAPVAQLPVRVSARGDGALVALQGAF